MWVNGGRAVTTGSRKWKKYESIVVDGNDEPEPPAKSTSKKTLIEPQAKKIG